jgi:hypothetical protein
VKALGRSEVRNAINDISERDARIDARIIEIWRDDCDKRCTPIHPQERASRCIVFTIFSIGL